MKELSKELIPVLNFDLSCADDQDPDEANPTAWVFDSSVPKVATELIEGIASRVVILDGEFYLVERLLDVDGVPTYCDAYEIAEELGQPLRAALRHTHAIEDGVYKCVAMGPGIEGNPLRLPYCCFHFYEVAPIVIEDAIPLDSPASLKTFLAGLKSHTGISKGNASGIVWHAKDGTGRMVKVRLGDL